MPITKELIELLLEGVNASSEEIYSGQGADSISVVNADRLRDFLERKLHRIDIYGHI